jgi:hypothetical protein
MATTALQQKDARAQASATTITMTFTSSLTAGSTVVGSVTWSGGPDTLTSVTVDSVTATLIDYVADTTNDQHIKSFYLKNVSAGAGVVLATFGSTKGYRAMAAHEVGGANTTTQPEDNNTKWWSTSPGTGTDANTANAAITPSLDGCYFFCSSMDSSNNNSVHTAGTSYTRDTNGSSSDVDFSSEHFIQTSAASLHGRWTESIANLMLTALVVVKASAAGGATVAQTIPGIIQGANNPMIGLRYV